MGTEHITQKLKEWISKDDRFEIIAPTPLTLICFRLKSSNDENEKLLYNINKSGSMYLSHTKLDNKYTLRFSIGTSTSSLDHVKKSWKKIESPKIFFRCMLVTKQSSFPFNR